jgi:diaminopropionate ammonia-lyase
MRMLAAGNTLDIPIVSGESGAAGLAGLIALCADPAAAAQLELDAASRVLLVNTEGATAPSVYRELTGEAAESVLRRQQAWRVRAAA